jgi:crotonyl-CoA carboxylase/reductase
VRYLWMRQKSIIGSHFANAYQATRANELIQQRKIIPVLSQTYPWEQCPVPHQMMRENAHLGKMVVLVGAAEPGLGIREA